MLPNAIRITTSAFLTDLQKEAALKLWNQEYPIQLQTDATHFNIYLSELKTTHFYVLVNKHDALIAWAATFLRNDEKWFLLIVDGSMQGSGYGTVILNQMKKREMQLTGRVVDHDHYTKVNGDSYRSPLKFYLKNGFKVVPNAKLQNAQLSAVKVIWEKQAMW